MSGPVRSAQSWVTELLIFYLLFINIDVLLQLKTEVVNVDLIPISLTWEKRLTIFVHQVTIRR